MRAMAMRGHIRRSLPVLALISVGGAGAPALAQQTEIGVAAAVAGDVRISTRAQPQERAVARRQRIAWGHVIRTARASQLSLLLLDRSTFSIGANTRMVIDRFVYDPDEGRSLVARVFTGAFRFLSGRNDPRATATITGPVGTIGIRGTALDGLVGEAAVAIARSEAAVGRNVRHDPETATLVVLRGPGVNTAGGLRRGVADVTAAGVTVTLDRPIMASYIPAPGMAPIGPFRLSDAGLARLQDELQPLVPRRDESGRGIGAALLGAAALVGAAVLLSGDDDNRNTGATGLDYGDNGQEDRATGQSDGATAQDYGAGSGSGLGGDAGAETPRRDVPPDREGGNP